MSPNDARSYFEFLADLGMTKHFGSMAATRELITLCHIESGQDVLDVGCGVGATPCYLTKAAGCRVVGVDLLHKMIVQSRERARREGVTDRVSFVVADARKLPFADARFDAVVMESLNVFFEDKQAAVGEYMRVTKPGGYVGLTEMTWLKSPAPDVAAYFERVVYARTLQASGWRALLEQAGLEHVVGNVYPVDIPVESKGRFERYGCWRPLKAILRMLALSVRDRGSRQFVKDGMGGVSKDLLDVMGYGVYAGRKR